MEREHPRLTSVMEREHPRLTSTEIEDRFLLEEALPVQRRLLFLHPGEKAHDLNPCMSYSLNSGSCPEGDSYYLAQDLRERSRALLRDTLLEMLLKEYLKEEDSGSCPKGDDCDSAHGLLERRFHPSKYSRKNTFFWDWDLEYLKEERLKKAGHLHPRPAGAGERNAIELILDPKGNNDLLHGYKPYDTQQVDACVPDSSNDVAIHELAVARTVSGGIFKHYAGINTFTGGIIERNLTNYIVISGIFFYIAPASDRYPGPHQGLFSTSNKDPNSGRFRRPIHLDSGASVHVVGDQWMLQGYQVLAEPWRIAVADGRPLVVVGIGFISLEGFMIPNVFHVQGLQMNLISVSQLDRDHGLFSGFHDGMCKVLKRGGDVVGGGFLLANGLYELSFLQVPETEILQVPDTEILQVPETEILQDPETETGEEAGSVIQAM